jgi:hypothetical protein
VTRHRVLAAIERRAGRLSVHRMLVVMDSIHAMDPEVAIKHHTDVATYSTMTE